MTACDELYLRISSLSFRATDIRRLNRRKCILFCIEAARLAHERRTSLLQYNTDAEVRGVMRAMHIQETDDYDGLKSALFEPFRMRTGLERFSAEIFRKRVRTSVCTLVTCAGCS
ncbi:hypothetical protein T06_6201 [Trichinella sp. T6]|nr:hypothetical protein T06_6201 [Trichinella sp. T6]